MQDDPLKPLPPDAGATPAITPPTSLPLPHPAPTEPNPQTLANPPASPAWANDLRKLYDAVVEEPLPDSLIALLSQLDAED